MQNLISVNDVSDVRDWVDQALRIKDAPFAQKNIGRDKTLGLLFLNPSLRTRMSTQKAALNLGMHVMVMNLYHDGWMIEFEDGSVMNHDTQEHIREAAAVISEYCDLVGIRTFPTLESRDRDYADTTIRQFIAHASVPVISLESAILHPLQSFADAITIREHKQKKTPKIVLSWAPHPRALPQAVANSFVEWIAKTDAELIITNPPGFNLAPRFSSLAPVVHNQEEAFEGADFIYAKNWSSYDEYGKKGRDLDHWIIDDSKMALTNEAFFMHCLPVRRNVVVSDQVIEGPRSLVIRQAKNREYAAQTALLNLLKHER